MTAASSSSSSSMQVLPISNNNNKRPMVYRRKYHLRAIFRSVAFLGLLATFGLYNVIFKTEEGITTTITTNDMLTTDTITTTTTINNNTPTSPHRTLQEEEEEEISCDSIEKISPPLKIILYLFGVLYMFLALAIVCDEFFVPALEEMSSERHLNLSMDVSGATLMAAGGSSPELFTALFGTFRESAVGFGTIVGSSVFNVLFVIGMCSLLSKEVLVLTWWPLARDCTYYIFGLIVLATFVGVVSEGEVELWEAGVLFLMYLGYVGVMAMNAKLYKMITGKELPPEDGGVDRSADDDFVVLEGGDTKKAATAAASTTTTGDYVLQSESGKNPSALSRAISKETGGLNQNMESIRGIRWHGTKTFRAGILTLISDPKTWSATAGVGLVAKIQGDVSDVFRHVDKDGDRMVNKEELKLVLRDLGVYLNEEEFEEMFEELDKNKDGMIDEGEFTLWYASSEKRLLANAENTFKKLDTNHSSTIDRSEIHALLHSIDPTVTDDEITSALQEMHQSGDENEISLKEFTDWYVNSFVHQRKKEMIEDEKEGIYNNLKPPNRKGKKGFWAWAEYLFVLPLVLTLAMTIPDVRRPGLGRYCYISFILSIAWIGVYSYFMVEWATLIGSTLNIPDIVMGLTFLAAGTSVPDLLSSVIVARMGQGDMAVSSSIGSNIFDILAGLPVPWLAYTLYPGKPDVVSVGADAVGISIVILVGMIALIITTIHFNGWKLTKIVGWTMFFFYFLFLVQAVYRELPFKTCV